MVLCIDLVTIHQIRALSECTNVPIPVCLEAASALTVCSKGISAAVREKELAVRSTERALSLSMFDTPGCVISVLRRLS